MPEHHNTHACRGPQSTRTHIHADNTLKDTKHHHTHQLINPQLCYCTLPPFCPPPSPPVHEYLCVCMSVARACACSGVRVCFGLCMRAPVCLGACALDGAFAYLGVLLLYLLIAANLNVACVYVQFVYGICLYVCACMNQPA